MLKSATFAALALTSGTVSAQSVSGLPAIPQSSLAASYDDYARFYAASKNAPIWFRSGQAEAGPALINILRRSTIEGFTRGPQLAAEVEAALARAQTGDPAALLEAEIGRASCRERVVM